MAFFGKNEAELKKKQEELDARERALSEWKRMLENRDVDVTKRETSTKERAALLSAKDTDLARRENEIIQRELDAKNNFAKQQREAFQEVIQVRLNELDAQTANIKQLELQVEEQFKKLFESQREFSAKESQLVERERTILDREIAAENGFAEKNSVAIRELEQRKKDIESFEEMLKEREKETNKRNLELQQQSETLRQREYSIKQAEIEREAGYSELRKNLDEELHQKRREYESQFADRKKKDEETQLEWERKLRSDLADVLQKERNDKIQLLETELVTKRQSFDKEIQQEREMLDKQRAELNKRDGELQILSQKLEIEQAKLQARSEQLDEREQLIPNEVERLIEERKKSFDAKEQENVTECERLRNSLQTLQHQQYQYEHWQASFSGKEPAVIIQLVDDLKQHQQELERDLATRPSADLQQRYDSAQDKIKQLEIDIKQVHSKNETLKQQGEKFTQIEGELNSVQQQLKQKEQDYNSLETHNNKLAEELKRLKTTYERTEDRVARIKDILEPPFIETSKVLPFVTDTVDEIEWLEGIEKSCIDYGLRFSKRILYAFHTALKTSEWSPLTVLAGVSGTGKSELPKLYAHFGGLNFLSTAVQPNWDSQEAMLGFFNSIDNKFDAQPILRFLAQTQQERTESPSGLYDSMNIVLLDEMNLAHIELYFAEFLSKLELRRGMKGKDNIPKLEVKIGAGIEPYSLRIERNVLWVGTMNQDETTKSLSDKVLDRGIVIHFPRPKQLERRKQLKALGKRTTFLNRKTWQTWWTQETLFDDTQIKPFKEFIETMNEHLAAAGRALGHRVWQSVEYYMSNYPTVRKAFQEHADSATLEREMRTAFEDQLVQKVMPKLRGIETRGKSKTDCLDKIRGQLIDKQYTIVDDFDHACEFGHGQFIWSSAQYLNESEPQQEQETKDTQNV
ncbi:MAG: hypothetical protein LBP87_15845 [Planctomycetaceae bacterium]|jgi:hypothetical protein|nr:hypothetical protein [Planctomycetaceae bacterium]